MMFCQTDASSGHFGGGRIASKVLKSYRPTLFNDAHHFYLACEHYQRTGALSRQDMMSLSPILIVEIFDVLDIDFMCHFPSFLGLCTYWLLLIMPQSRLKLWLPGLMTIRWWSSL